MASLVRSKTVSIIQRVIHHLGKPVHNVVGASSHQKTGYATANEIKYSYAGLRSNQNGD